jgi:uncharacterized DUF497 family protein
VIFEWDEDKSRANIRKHGLSVTEAHELFGSLPPVDIDKREPYGEQRWRGSSPTELSLLFIRDPMQIPFELFPCGRH